MNRSTVAFGADIGTPDPASTVTAESALADYNGAAAVARQAQARAFATPGDTALAQAARAAQAAAAAALLRYQKISSVPAPPMTSAAAYSLWQRAVHSGAPASLVAIYKRAYLRRVAAEDKTGSKPFVPTGGVGPDGKSLDVGTTSFKDVLVVAALTSPAWGTLLWRFFGR